jgi:hypothetical protein
MSVRETEYSDCSVKDVHFCVGVGVPLVSAVSAHEHRLALAIVLGGMPARVALPTGVASRDLDGDEDPTG